jgi:hypothetical protein
MTDDGTDPWIAAVRRELRPSAAAQAATWAALRARIDADEHAALPPAPRFAGRRAPFLIGVAIAAAAAVLLVAWLGRQPLEVVEDGARAQAVDRARADSTGGEAHTRRDRSGGTATAREPRAAPPAAAPTPTPAPMPDPPPGPAARAADGATAPAGPTGEGEGEVELVVRARAALVDGDAEAALALAREAARRFPTGPLAIERAAIEMRALCRLGRADAARVTAEALARTHAGSEVAAALARRPCANE